MFDNRLAFVLADEKVNGELATLRVAVARHMLPDSAAGVLHILAGLPSIFLRALDRSAPETLDSVREAAAKALYLRWFDETEEPWESLPERTEPLEGRDKAEFLFAVDAVAPLLAAPLRTEIERLTARLAEVEGAVREWQEARTAWNDAFDASPGLAWVTRNTLLLRLNSAEAELAALSLEAPRE